MSSIYTMEHIPGASSLQGKAIDLLIISANGDNRTCEGIDRLLKNGTQIVQLIVLKFDSEAIPSENPLYPTYCRYLKFPILIKEIDCVGNTINLGDIEVQGKNVALDITGFSTPNLFRMLFIFREIYGVHQLHVFYTEPRHYIFESDSFSSYAYYIGEREYRALDEFYISGGDGKELLTIFLGFDRMTSSIVKEAVNPTETILVNGFPAMTPKLKDISLLNNRELISIIGKPLYSVKTNNPFATYNVLASIQHEHQDTLINVCVLGTKPMALGAGIYALQNKNIKLSYTYTKAHAYETSIGSSHTWYYYFEL